MRVYTVLTCMSKPQENTLHLYKQHNALELHRQVSAREREKKKESRWGWRIGMGDGDRDGDGDEGWGWGMGDGDGDGDGRIDGFVPVHWYSSLRQTALV